MFAEELGDLKNRYGPRLQLVHVLSREPRDVELFSGRLDADRLRRLLDGAGAGRRASTTCGCAARSRWSTTRARCSPSSASRPDRVHFELFYVDEPPPELHRADAGARGRDQRGHRRPRRPHRRPRRCRAARPILDAAQAARADLPFACKGGVCGTCRALVAEGEVDMRRNYALEEAEVDAGFVLTCQTHPVSDAVTVDFDA